MLIKGFFHLTYFWDIGVGGVWGIFVYESEVFLRTIMAV